MSEIGKIDLTTRRIDTLPANYRNAELVRNWFEFNENDTIPTQQQEEVKVDNKLEEAKKKANELKIKGAKPSMGLTASPEVKKQSQNVENTERQAESNNHNALLDQVKAEDNVATSNQELSTTRTRVKSEIKSTEIALTETKLTSEENITNAKQAAAETQETTESNNNNAEQALTDTQNQTEQNISTANTQLENTEDQAASNNEQAEAQVEEATSGQENAQSLYDDACNAVRDAQNSLSQAQALLSGAKTEQERAAAQEQIQAAEKALESAKQNQDAKKQELDNAKRSVEQAESNQETVKRQGEEAVETAQENVTSVTEEGEQAVQEAEENVENVAQEGENAIQEAEGNVEQVTQDGKNAIQEAEENIEQVTQDGQNIIRETEENVNEATDILEERTEEANITETEGEIAIETEENVLEETTQTTEENQQTQEEIDSNLTNITTQTPTTREVIKNSGNALNEINQLEKRLENISPETIEAQNAERQERVQDNVTQIHQAFESGDPEAIGNAIKKINKKDGAYVYQQYEQQYGKSLARAIKDSNLTNLEKNDAMYDLMSSVHGKPIQRNSQEEIERNNILFNDSEDAATTINNRTTRSCESYLNKYSQQTIDKYNQYIAELEGKRNNYQQQINELERTLSAESVYRGTIPSEEETQQQLRTSAAAVTPSNNINTSANPSNGSFDLDSTQQRGNCWIHATINSMTATERGTNRINTFSEYNQETGGTAVTFPEAQIYSTGPNNNGVYSYSREFVSENIARNQSEGDGDYGAFCQSVYTHINETEGNLDEGNYPSRGYELISGRTTATYNNHSAIPDGVGHTLGSSQAHYNNMQEALNSGIGAFQVDFNDELPRNASCVDHNYQDVEQQPFLSTNHAYAVKRLTNDYAYLQESNNPGVYIKIPKDNFIRSVFRTGSYIF